MSYRVHPCQHGFPAQSCPFCGSEPESEELPPEWIPEFHASPEYVLNLYSPPLWWRKKDRDALYRTANRKGWLIW